MAAPKAKKKKMEQNGSNGASPADFKKQNDHTENAPLAVNAQYIKDLSFENPNAISNLMKQEAPSKTDISIEVNGQHLSDRTFEVVLKMRGHIKREEETVYLMELQYAGIFSLGNDVPDELVRPILMVECPRILFPFARGIMARVTQESGFPPLFLDPVNFADLFRSQLEAEIERDNLNKPLN